MKSAKFLNEITSILGLSKDDELKYVNIVNYDGFSHLLYQQYYKGLKVYTGEYTVHLNSNENIILSNGRYFCKIDVNTHAKVSKKSAVEIALNELNISKDNLIVQPRTELMVYPLKDKIKLTWMIKIWKTELEGWTYIIDANNGEILKTASSNLGATGKGNIYPIDPVNSSLTQKNIYRLNGNGYLDGQITSVFVQNPPLWERAYSGSHKFLFDELNDHQYEVNVYYHIDKIGNDFFNNQLGYFRGHINTNIKNVPSGAYVPESIIIDEQITMGVSGDEDFNPASRKDDIIYHEYTHSVIWKIGLRNDVPESTSRHEGYSDYFAASFTNDPEIGEWFYKNYPNMRILNTSPSVFNYKNWGNLDYNNNAIWYTNSMIWSGACWDLRNSLGKAIADQLIFDGIFYAPGNQSFDAALDGIVDANNIRFGGQYTQTILSVFENRGIGKPSVPSNFSISGSVGEHPTLTWSLNSEPDMSGYKLYTSYDGGAYTLLTILSKYTNSFTDQGVIIGDGKFDPSMCYKISAYDIHGNESDKSVPKCVKTDGLNKSFEKNSSRREQYTLKLNNAYPNPFNPVAKIEFLLQNNSYVNLAVYNMLGEKIVELVNGELKSGVHVKEFNGENLTSGVYFYKIEVMDFTTRNVFTDIRKIVLSK